VFNLISSRSGAFTQLHKLTDTRLPYFFNIDLIVDPSLGVEERIGEEIITVCAAAIYQV
jgi:hypothetical protein